ncbi:uncharacterized protein PAC_12274 [Phialocephala subalpina]|uniref:Uncharacterized protein n=1 Tax=Phialocephala subalpina TaxID=576137 RepID=A0A1L7XBN5_9HELO|nr:uncharacterized protein PAC_12274 [Phialocephala subalpina]
MKWICCGKHSNPSNPSLPWTNPHYIKTCTFQGCNHERCGRCTLPSIEDWYSTPAPTPAQTSGKEVKAGANGGAGCGSGAK